MSDRHIVSAAGRFAVAFGVLAVPALGIDVAAGNVVRQGGEVYVADFTGKRVQKFVPGKGR